MMDDNVLNITILPVYGTAQSMCTSLVCSIVVVLSVLMC